MVPDELGLPTLEESDLPVLDEFSLAVVAVRTHAHEGWASGVEIGRAADDVVEQLKGCGAAPVLQAEKTDLEGIRQFLSTWAKRDPPTSSILYWVGHGSTDGEVHWLVTSNSGQQPQVDDSLKARDLAEYLRKDGQLRERIGGSGMSDRWTVLILDCCGAAVARTNLVNELTSRVNTRPDQTVIVATTQGSSGYVRGFNDALALAIASFDLNEPTIRLDELLLRLKNQLGDQGAWGDVPPNARIHNPRQSPEKVVVPMDAVAQVAALSRTKQREPAPLRQSTELGDFAWYFAGRERELEKLHDWLARDEGGLQVVTGRPGTGKSALVREVIEPARKGDLAARSDASVLLTGKTLRGAVDLISTSLFGADEPMREAEDLFAAVEQASERRFRIVVDALDEAVDPHVLAATLLRPLASLANVQLLVATRGSLAERLGKPTSEDRSILDALGSAAEHELTLGPDAGATRRYVLHHLGSAIDELAVAEKIAVMVASREQPLLFARMVVTELLASGVSRLDEQAHTLIAGDPETVFEHARKRVESREPAILALLRALAFAAGRGLPRLDGQWLTVAQALHPDQEISDADLALALSHRPRESSQVAPYIMLDSEHDQSTYRLSHRAFVEYLLAETEAREDGLLEAHTRIALALIAAGPRDGQPSPYTARYLPWHLAESAPDTWRALVELPSLLDRLVPGAMAAEAMRVLDAQHELPLEIKGLIASRHRIDRGKLDDREGLRQIGMATCSTDGAYACSHPGPGPGMSWNVRSAVLRPHPVHMTIHARAEVCALTCLEGPDGMQLLAAGCRDGSVRLWRAGTGEPFGDPIPVAPGRPLLAICALPHREGVSARFVVSDDEGRVGIWNALSRKRECLLRQSGASPARALNAFLDQAGAGFVVADTDGCAAQVWSTSGEEISQFTDHKGPVRAIACMRSGDGATIVASAGEEDMVRLWNPVTGKQIGAPLQEHREWVTALAAYTRPDGRAGLVSGGDDAAILLWDPSDPDHIPPPRRLEHPGGRVRALCTYVASDSSLRVLSGGQDGTVRVWDLQTQAEIGPPLTGHTQAVLATVPCSDPSVSARVASTAGSEQIFIWNPDTALAPRGATERTFRETQALTMLEPDSSLFVTGEDKGAVRFWTRATGEAAFEPLPGHDGTVHAVASYMDDDGTERLASAGADGTVHIWRPGDPTVPSVPLYGHTRGARAIATYTVSGSARLATGSEAGDVRVWNATTGEALGDPLHCEPGWVRDIAAYVGADGDPWLAVVGYDRAVRLLNTSTRCEPQQLTGHENWVMAVCTFTTFAGEPRVVTAAADATLRLWDPVAGEEVGRLNGDKAPMRSVSATMGVDKQCHIVGGDDEGTIWIWLCHPSSGVGSSRTIPLEIPIRALELRGTELLVGTTEGHILLDLSGALPSG